MISEHERLEAYRADLLKQVPYSTDPQRLRDLAGVHQYSRTFCICMAILGAFAFGAAFVAIGSI